MVEPPHFFEADFFYFNLLDIGTGRAAVLATRSGRRILAILVKWPFDCKTQLSQLESLEF